MHDVKDKLLAVLPKVKSGRSPDLLNNVNKIIIGIYLT